MNEYKYLEFQEIYEGGKHSFPESCSLEDTFDLQRRAESKGAGFQISIFGTIKPLSGNTDEKSNQFISLNKFGDFVLESDHFDFINQARTLIKFFENDLRIPPGCINYSFSGNRSIHIKISAETFGITPRADLPQIFKEMANIIQARTGTELDTAIYRNRGFIRTFGLRPDTGTYKIPITKEELFSIDTREEFMDLAKSPRPNFKRILNRPFPYIHEANTLYREAVLRVKEKREFELKQGQKINLSQKEIKLNLSGNIPPCINHLLQEGPAEFEGARHYSSLFHIAYCKAAGMDKEQALEQVLIWNLNCNSKSKPREIKNEVKGQINTVYRSNQYKFYCKGQAKNLCLTCNSTCPLYEKVSIVNSKVKEIPLSSPEDENNLYSVEDARAVIEKTIENQIVNLETSSFLEEKNLLLIVPPGLGKSTIAIQKATDLKSDNDNRRFIYCHERIEHLEELMVKGELPPDIWRIIYGRKQIKEECEEGERPGNCYHADKISELLSLRIPPEKINQKICGNCEYKDLCNTSPDMYKGQWHTTKNLAMTHAMYTLAGTKANSTQKIDISIIDEDIHKQLSEKIQVKKGNIEGAITELEGKPEQALFKALLTVYEEVGQKTENFTLTGPALLESISGALNENLETHLNSISDIEEEVFFTVEDAMGYQWKKDFFKALLDEIRLYKEYETTYNSNIYMKFYQKHGNVDFYFYQRRNLPNIPAIILDATGKEEIYKQSFPRLKTEEIKIKLPPELEIIQIKDGKYGKSYQTENEILQFKFSELINSLEEQNKNLFISGWKSTAENYPENFKWFYGLRGTNKYEDCSTVVILGTPNIRPEHLQEEARILFKEGPPVDFTVNKEYVSYNCNIDGKNYAIETPVAIDARYKALWNTYREDEILQAVHRIRPLLKEKSKIYLLTSLPVPGLSPTKILPIEKLIQEEQARQKLTKNNPDEIINQVENEVKDFLKNQFWTFEKWNSIVTELTDLLQNGESLMWTKGVSSLPSLLYIEVILDLIFTSLIVNVNLKKNLTTSHYEVNTAFLELSKGSRYNLYKKFCENLKLNSQKFNFTMDNKNINITANYSGKELEPCIIKSEYLKFKHLESTGRILSLICIEKIGELSILDRISPFDFIKSKYGLWILEGMSYYEEEEFIFSGG